jgi:hypothetical protein
MSLSMLVGHVIAADAYTYIIAVLTWPRIGSTLTYHTWYSTHNPDSPKSSIPGPLGVIVTK